MKTLASEIRNQKSEIRCQVTPFFFLIPDIWSFLGLVVMARAITPDPIPNSAVKTLRAHGTAAQAAEE